MRTIKQVEGKIESLKRSLSGKQVYENFGDKEQRKLDNFVGFIHDYDYQNKPRITTLVQDFHEWCYKYNG